MIDSHPALLMIFIGKLMLKDNEKVVVSELGDNTEAVTLTKKTIATLAMVMFMATLLAGACLLYIQGESQKQDIYYMPASHSEYDLGESNVVSSEYEDRHALPESVMPSNDYDDIKDIDTPKDVVVD